MYVCTESNDKDLPRSQMEAKSALMVVMGMCP